MPAQVQDLATRFITALQTFEKDGGGALEPLVTLFAPVAELTNPALALAGERKLGPDEIRHFWQTYRDVLGQATSTFDRVTVTDDAAGLFWTTHAKGASGESVSYEGASLLVFDGEGRITRFRAYFDQKQLASEARR